MPPGGDGTGDNARFNLPHGIVRDGGYLYVADAYNHTIRRIDLATTQVTTLAGAVGVPGSTDAKGSAARFKDPHDIVSDGINLYITDYGNHTIRRLVLATGEVTTLAGSALATGFVNGTAAAARFNGPSSLVREGGNLYVTDYGNYSIRRIDIATAAVTTLAGSGTAGSNNGTGSAAQFNSPYGIASDGTNLYVTEAGGHTIRRIDIATGVVTTLAGTANSAGATDGIGAAARFSTPLGIYHHSGSLYVADSVNQLIRRIDIASATVMTLAGSPAAPGSTDGVGSAARFNGPRGITGDGANLYIADMWNNIVRRMDIATTAVKKTAAPCSYCLPMMPCVFSPSPSR